VIKLGSLVKDATTGFSGIAVNRAEYLSGTVQYGISAPQDDKGLCRHEYVDEQALDIIGEGVQHRTTPPSGDDTIKLGDHMRCKVTGFEGVATLRSTNFNGCIQYALQGKAKDNVIPDAQYFDYKYLEPVENMAPITVKSESSGPAIGTIRQPKAAF
jgi:hypothetical protein